MKGLRWTSTVKLIGAAIVAATVALAADASMAHGTKGKGGYDYERTGYETPRAKSHRHERYDRHRHDHERYNRYERHRHGHQHYDRPSYRYIKKLAHKPVRWHRYKKRHHPRWYARNVVPYFDDMPRRWHKRMHRKHPRWYHRNVAGPNHHGGYSDYERTETKHKRAEYKHKKKKQRRDAVEALIGAVIEQVIKGQATTHARYSY